MFGRIDNFDRLLLKPVAISVVNFAGDLFAGGGEVGVRFGGFVDKDESSFGVDADAVEKFA